MKSIIKEIRIVLLLLLAMILVLGVFLYDYIPTSKIVPKIEQYQVPNNIKEELEKNVNDTEEKQPQIVYEVDGKDLKNAEKSKDYQKGKVNPFSQNTEGNTAVNNTNKNNTAGTNNSNSVGNYLPQTGTK
ncbi:hypothetical protein [Thomasclavelia cocleata]|uniref:hypothetical protein n=1 Tax=Thomasclavelia cocleata TaxID=69824 RepID=UPI00272EBC56|nr:hypothetical protein [Thomasclavelia cocleata]